MFKTTEKGNIGTSGTSIEEPAVHVDPSSVSSGFAAQKKTKTASRTFGPFQLETRPLLK